MRLLIDSPTLLWWVTDSARLSQAARRAIADDANAIAVGSGSLWEIATKRSAGKLQFPHDFETVLRDEEFELLAVTYAHLRVLESLPLHHRDPFDRLLIAQSLAEGMPIVTDDPGFAAYDVSVVW